MKPGVVTFLFTVLFAVTCKVNGYDYFFGAAGDTVSEIKKYDTLKADLANTLNKYTKPKAAACKKSVVQQPSYKNGPSKIAAKINEATLAIQKVDQNGHAQANKCGTGAANNDCVEKVTNSVNDKLKAIKGPAISFINNTKGDTLKSVQAYMDNCTK